MARIIAIDTETYYDKVCTVRKLGPYTYTRHPDFYCYLISVYDGEEMWVGTPEEFDWSCIEGAHLISHNAMFDRCVIESMMERSQIPKFTPARWDCTSDMSAYICNRRSLKDSIAFLFGRELSKDARSDMEGLHWRDVKDTPQGKAFLEYAGVDAVECWNIYNKFSYAWPEEEQMLSRKTRDQGIRGVQIDVPKLTAYLESAKKLLFKIEARLPWIEEGAKPTSTKAIAMACRAAGIPTPPVKSREGEEAFQAWEKTHRDKYPWIGAAAQWRSLNKFIGELETIQERLRPDGTMPFSLKYAGAHTLRFSGDAGFNMQNLRRNAILVDAENFVRLDDDSIREYDQLAEKMMTPGWLGRTDWGIDGEENAFEHIYDIRSLIIARPGFKLALCDLAQIEPRVLASLANAVEMGLRESDPDKVKLEGTTKLLEAIRNGFGVYEANAVSRGIYTGPKGGFKKMRDLYQAIKAQVLAMGYGVGWERYIEAAMTLAGYDVCANDPIDPATGKKIYGYTARKEVKEFREQNPEIPQLWNVLDNAFRGSLGGNYIMELPSGRSMVYRDVRRIRKKKIRNIIDESTGEILETKIEEKWAYSAEIDGRRYELYGGLLAENATQAVARDVFVFQLFNLMRAGIQILWTIHDEAVCEVPLDSDVKVIEQLMSVTPPWLAGCPIGAEAKESNCYLK